MTGVPAIISLSKVIHGARDISELQGRLASTLLGPLFEDLIFLILSRSSFSRSSLACFSVVESCEPLSATRSELVPPLGRVDQPAERPKELIYRGKMAVCLQRRKHQLNRRASVELENLKRSSW